MHYHLPYPTQTCRWGPLVEDLGYKSRYRAYLSEQVVDGERPNTLLLAHIDVMKPHVASCEAVSNWQDKSVSSHVTIIRTVYHPGEVNKVRELPAAPHVVVTHTDSKHLYVWNMDRQPDRRPAASGVAAAAAASKGKRGGDKGGDKGGDATPSVADLVLTGHEDEALFPLACSSAGPYVASGGNDQLVLLWDLADSMTALAAVPSREEGGAAGGGGGGAAGGKAPQLKARTRLQGHTATVGDVCFAPGSGQLLVSVADDGRMLLWDTRSGLAPVGCVEEAHGGGVNVMCVDWCPLDEQLLVSGAEQGSIKVWDRRRLGAGAAGALHSFDAHTNNAEERDIIHVEWHPRNKDVFASGSVDRTVAIWDLSRGRPTPAPAPAAEPEAATAGADTDQAAPGEAAPKAAADATTATAAADDGGKARDGDTEMADAGAAAEAAPAEEAAKAGGAAAEAGKAEAADATATAAAAAAGEEEQQKGADAAAPEGGTEAGQGKDADAGEKGKKEEAAAGAEPPKKKKKTADKDKDGGGGGKADDDGLPPQLIFQHLGHRLGRVTDFQWHPDPNEPWTLISVSDNTGDEAADGTLQVWRISDLIYRPYEEAVQELEQHRQFILHGNTGAAGGPDCAKAPSAAAGGGKGKDAKAEAA
ncbi:hypothetical protein HXX76_005179 [Chlamydomonas incerta]|uniref:Histone-binding protein RBBP4 N-terminal domain-containing protein n=1 Tax=Chlamydomonas incerta TaxID=51695 RepID=A0A835T720_CHLIN|nr:hypothetical protein HXX76_005179 [Chlamydomonas incerta]|eukprot:KAG2438631.1 hypothetical protein HXX76_005179 [Chlamydomonas incerta]